MGVIISVLAAWLCEGRNDSDETAIWLNKLLSMLLGLATDLINSSQPTPVAERIKWTRSSCMARERRTSLSYLS